MQLLKLVDVLTAALRANTDTGADDVTEVDIAKFDLSQHADALKNTRVLASQITTRGSSLHELLGDEVIKRGPYWRGCWLDVLLISLRSNCQVELREARADAIARPLDVDDIERGVTRTIALAREEIERTKALMDNVGADEANLAQKIEIKQAEIDRNNKRLRSLEGYRPPYMDEYEKYEAELKEQVLTPTAARPRHHASSPASLLTSAPPAHVWLSLQYDKYIEEFRNLTYLENQVERLQQEDEDLLAHAMSNRDAAGEAAG